MSNCKILSKVSTNVSGWSTWHVWWTIITISVEVLPRKTIASGSRKITILKSDSWFSSWVMSIPWQLLLLIRWGNYSIFVWLSIHPIATTCSTSSEWISNAMIEGFKHWTEASTKVDASAGATILAQVSIYWVLWGAWRKLQ